MEVPLFQLSPNCIFPITVIDLRPFVLILFFSIFCSCDPQQEQINVDWHIQADASIQDFLIDHDGFIACGGVLWESGFILRKQPNDPQKTESVGTNILMTIGKDVNDVHYAGGIFSMARTYGDNWAVKIISEEGLIRDILIDSTAVYVVAGAGLAVGNVYEISKDLSEEYSTSKVERELNCIVKCDDQIFIGGFGAIYHYDSVNALTRLDIDGDHFIDLECSDKAGLLALGATGLVIQSKDGGDSWTQLRNGTSLTDENFTDMIVNEDEIFLAKGNQIIHSQLNTINWESWELESEFTINKMRIFKDSLYLATQDGQIGAIQIQ